jgi:hypothetical protein
MEDWRSEDKDYQEDMLEIHLEQATSKSHQSQI